jgi:hypothetical protein
MQNFDHNIVFLEKRQFFRRKLAKIAENWQKSPKIGKNRRKLAKVAENCDHNTGLRTFFSMRLRFCSFCNLVHVVSPKQGCRMTVISKITIWYRALCHPTECHPTKCHPTECHFYNIRPNVTQHNVTYAECHL